MRFSPTQKSAHAHSMETLTGGWTRLHHRRPLLAAVCGLGLGLPLCATLLWLIWESLVFGALLPSARSGSWLLFLTLTGLVSAVSFGLWRCLLLRRRALIRCHSRDVRSFFLALGPLCVFAAVLTLNHSLWNGFVVGRLIENAQPLQSFAQLSLITLLELTLFSLSRLLFSSSMSWSTLSPIRQRVRWVESRAT